MDNKIYKENVSELLSGLNQFVSSKTVVGEPVRIDDTVLIPFVDVSFGLGAGSLGGDKKESSGGGMGCKMTPSAVIVIHNGSTRLMNISTHTGMDKVLDMLPDFVDRFSDKVSDKKESKAREAAAEDIRKKLDDAVDALD